MQPNCFSCRYFKVTWEQAAPRACVAHGFKTRELPSAVVRKASGLPCQLFQKKEGTRK